MASGSASARFSGVARHLTGRAHAIPPWLQLESPLWLLDEPGAVPGPSRGSLGSRG